MWVSQSAAVLVETVVVLVLVAGTHLGRGLTCCESVANLEVRFSRKLLLELLLL